MKNWFKKNWILMILLLLFLVLRLPAVDQIYHQDEHRWVMQADPRFDEVSPHPPLAKYYFRLIGSVSGFDKMRWAPLFFSIGNLFLVYLVSLKLAKNKVVALISSTLFSINIYSIIASLQIDIDGAILPFFVLLGFWAYVNVLEQKKGKYWWGLVLAISVVGGFLTKLSFILFAIALVSDYLFRLYLAGVNIRKILKLVFRKLIFPVVGFAVIFYFVYTRGFGWIVIDYAGRFNSLNFGSRAYFDLVFKLMKSFIWLSPLLAMPVICGIFSKEIVKRYFFWYVYLGMSLLFYLIIFDFTRLTIEKYLMFLIIPSVLIGGEVLFNWINKLRLNTTNLVASLIFVSFFVSLIFLPYEVLPLNPKEGYITKIKDLEFNFLIPFSGGSGPIGFYFSALFILASWFVSSLVLGVDLIKKQSRTPILIFIILGLIYNLLFFVEYSQGYFYGSPDKLTKKSLDYILSNQDMNGIITYYDIGAYELKMNNKYYSRFYTAPRRDYTSKLSTFRGYYLIVDFPAIDKKGRYWPLIERCGLDKEFNDKYINSYIFNCSNLSSGL